MDGQNTTYKNPAKSQVVDAMAFTLHTASLPNSIASNSGSYPTPNKLGRNRQTFRDERKCEFVLLRRFLAFPRAVEEYVRGMSRVTSTCREGW
jgi:hypothetical protein